MNPINNDYWVPQARFYSTRFYFTRFRLQYSSTVQCHSVKTLHLAVVGNWKKCVKNHWFYSYL